MTARPGTGIARGDRVLLMRRGAGDTPAPAGDVIGVFGNRPRFADVSFRGGRPVLCLADQLQPIPRRPEPMW